MQARWEDYQSAIHDLSLAEIQAAGASAMANWTAAWMAYVFNGNLQHPPHKPPL